MSILDAYIPFVKDNASFHGKKAEEFRTSSPSRAKRHRDSADLFERLLVDIAAVSPILDSPLPTIAAQQPAQPKNLKLSLTEEDLEGLPQELLNELSISSGDRTDFAVLSILEEAGGITSLDRLLISLYRKTGEIQKRDKLTSRLYRMVQKNLIYNMPGKKGVYSLEPPAGSETYNYAGAASEDPLLK